MTELQQILENSKLTAEKIEANLQHTFLQTKLQPREVFSEITETVDSYFTTGNGIRALGYAGLRGTGKTTLLWQTAEYIYNNFTQNIYFFDFSNLMRYDISIWDIKDAFEKYIVKDYLAAYREKIVLIFDEVHESPMWAKALKSLYDDFRIAFILTSGSSALLLQSTADLVTRMLIQHVFPLNFREYVGFTQQNSQTINNTTKKQLLKAIFNSENANDLFDKLQNIKPELDTYLNRIDNSEKRIYDYIVYRNIIRFLLIDSELKINEQIIDLVRRVIYEDIPKIAELVNPRYAEKILTRLAASDEINIQTLSQSIGISQDKINEGLDILEKAELLNVLYPYGGIDSKINKTKKYFFMSPSIRKAILTPFAEKDTSNIYAKMLEDTIILYLKRIFRNDNFLSFSSGKGQKNPDLIIETLNEPIVLEIGINKNTTKQISKSKIKYKYGIIINSKTDKIELRNDIVIIPLKYFLLL